MTWKGVIFGFIIGLAALFGAVFFYFKLGYAPVATAAAPMPMETYLAHTALHAKIAREAPETNPVQPTEANFMAGAKQYRDDCAVCHGLPGRPRSDIAKGMFPKPPQLFAGKGVTDDPAGETYWKIRNGIRLTGMPGFGDSLSDVQMWQIATLLAQADKLPASVQQELNRLDTIEVPSLRK